MYHHVLRENIRLMHLKNLVTNSIMMNRLVIGLIIMTTSFQLVAHNAKIATFNMRQFDGVWVLEMAFAQASLDGVIRESLSQEEIDQLSQDELKVWLVDYVRKNVFIKSEFINSIELGEGGIRLGSHQTDFKFILHDLPSNPGEVEMVMPICSNSRNHTSLLRIFYGDQMHKIFLSSDNDFTTRISIDNGMLEKVEARTSQALSSWWLLLFSPVLLLMGRFRGYRSIQNA